MRNTGWPPKRGTWSGIRPSRTMRRTMCKAARNFHEDERRHVTEIAAILAGVAETSAKSSCAPVRATAVGKNVAAITT